MSDNTSEKVVNIVDYAKDSEECKAEAKAAKEAVETSRDMGKAALILTLIMVVLASVFYFMLSNQIGHIGKETLAVRQDLTTLDGRVNQLESIPAKTKQLVLSSMIQEMTKKAEFLSREVTDPAQKEKLEKALELMRDAASPAE